MRFGLLALACLLAGCAQSYETVPPSLKIVPPSYYSRTSPAARAAPQKFKRAAPERERPAPQTEVWQEPIEGRINEVQGRIEELRRELRDR